MEKINKKTSQPGRLYQVNRQKKVVRALCISSIRPISLTTYPLYLPMTLTQIYPKFLALDFYG